MKRFRKLIYGAEAALVLLGSGTALSAQERLKWGELEQAVSGKTITVVLSSGQRLQGKVLDVGAQTFWMQVKSTSAHRDYPKGKLSLPRQSISVLELRTKTGGGPRKVLVGVGVGVGATLAIAALFLGQSVTRGDIAPREGEDPKETDRRVKGYLIGIGALSAVGGIAIGEIAGRQQGGSTVRIITVIPEDDEKGRAVRGSAENRGSGLQPVIGR